MFGGAGSSTRNILLYGLRAHAQSEESKVNLVITSNSGLVDNDKRRIRVSVMPLVGDDTAVQRSNTQECVIDDSNAEQCSVYVRNAFDYDVRLQNMGEATADLKLLTVDIPENPLSVDFELVSQMETDQELHTQPAPGLSREHGSQHPVFALLGVAAFGVLLAYIAGVLYRRLKLRRQRAPQHMHPVAGMIVEEEDYVYETAPYVSMDNEQLCYQVFSVPDHSPL